MLNIWVKLALLLSFYFFLALPPPVWAAPVTVVSYPTSCSSLAGTGRSWSRASRAVSSNNSYSYASVDGTTTNYLQCTGYGFNIPNGAVINGISVNLERRSNSMLDGGSRDAAMRLVKGGVIGTTDRATSTTYTTSDNVEGHGGTSDLWGTSWTPADINATNFGAAFMATKPSSAGNSHTVYVDVMYIVVIYTPDATPPVVSSISRANFTPTGATSVSWNVVFSESVTGVDAADFSLAQSGGVSGATITSVTGSGTTYTVTASTGSGSGSLGLNLVDNDTILDLASNRLGGNGANNGNFTGQVYAIDKVNPTVISITRANPSPTTASSVAWTVLFSKSVTGVDAGDFSLAVGAGLSGTSITSVTGSGSSYTVTANTGVGSGTLGLNLIDNDTIIDSTNNKLAGTGLGNGSQAGEVYALDRSWPIVTSITRDFPSPTTSDTVSWTVVFSKDVTGVDLTDFNLASSGLSGAYIVSLTGSGTTWSVVANTGVGSGSLGLNVVDDDTIMDSLSQKLGNTGVGNGNFTGEVYVVSDTPPVARYHMNEALWNGTTDEVIDDTGNNYSGTAKNGASTASESATCRYGVFDNGGTITRGYVSLGVDFPDFEDDFTMAAWIRTTDNSKNGQYIFTDNVSGSGYYLSLGDAGAGALRFYSDGASSKNLDSGAVINNNTWYFVAISADFSSPPNITRKLYVYSASGALLSGFPISLSTDGWTSDPGDATLGGNASASATTNHFRGNIDEVSIYGKLLNQAAISALAANGHGCSTVCSLGSFRITQDSTALSCPDTRAAVTIEPMCTDGVTVKTGYAGTVTLGVTPTNANAAFYTAASGGSASNSLTFSAELSKTAYLYYPNETLACVTANDGVVSTTASSCTDFRAYGFRVSSQPGDFACGDSGTLTLTAYGKVDTGPACSVIPGFSGNKDLKAWFTTALDSDSPSTAQATNRSLTITGSAAGITNVSEPASANLSNVSFSGGSATLTLGYANAGKILGVNFKHDSPPYNGNACTATAKFCPLTAQSSAFLVYPNSFALTVTDSGSACVAGNDSCPAFKAAGNDVNMNLQALCKDGTTVASDYRNGTTPIALGVSAVAPAAAVGGSNGSVATTSISITSAGSKAFTQAWSEVGVAAFTAVPPVWFARTLPSANSGSIGRFYPDHFTLNNGSTVTAATGAGGFTYMSQPAISLKGTVQARAKGAASGLGGTGTLTSNYHNFGTNLNFAPGAVNFVAENADDGIDRWGRLTATLPTGWNKGQYILNASDGSLARLPGGPDGPFESLQFGVKVSDQAIPLENLTLNAAATGCGSACNAAALGSSTRVRFGRLRLSNVFGSVKPLKMPVETQYWGGKSWIKNTDDTGATGTSLSLMTFTLTPTGWPAPAVPATLSSGENFIPIMPSSVGSKTMTADLTAQPWLKSMWGGSAAYDRNPSATANFGIYTPEFKKTIHIREVF